MASADIVTPDIQEMHRILFTHSLELTYEKSLRGPIITHGEEQARILRVGILLLENENDDFHTRLLQGNRRSGNLEKTLQESCVRLSSVEAERESILVELRTRFRELENLKAELDSLQDVSLDSTKLLTEKLALSRELAILMPEIEHLRSQAALHQTLLAEKLTLQRQFFTMQVELENEKRATHRAVEKEGGRQEDDARMELKLEELQSEIVKEQKETKRAQREAQKATADSESKIAVLESRLEGFRSKLRMTKDQLKETQSELQSSRSLVKDQTVLPTILNAGHPHRNPRKRVIAQSNTDATFGTPGILPAVKRGKRGSTLPGGKSAFSITPYLNRTTSLAPESPTVKESITGGQSDVEERDSGIGQELVATRPREATEVSKPREEVEPSEKKIRAHREAVLVVANVGKLNVRGGPPRTKQSVLEQVHEEDDEENHPLVGALEVGKQANTVTRPGNKPSLNGDGAEDTTFIKKKRKLLGGGLGRTLFDEEDGVANRDNDGELLGRRRTLAPLGKGSTVGQTGSRTGFRGSTKAFGTFSPLKKERKFGIN